MKVIKMKQTNNSETVKAQVRRASVKKVSAVFGLMLTAAAIGAVVIYGTANGGKNITTADDKMPVATTAATTVTAPEADSEAAEEEFSETVTWWKAGVEDYDFAEVTSAETTTTTKKATTTKKTTTAAETTTRTEIEFDGPKYETYAAMTPEEIVSTLTLEQKAAQMVQPAIYNITEEDMKANDYGSILSTVGCIDSDVWAETVDGFQQGAIESEAGIPYTTLFRSSQKRVFPTSTVRTMFTA